MISTFIKIIQKKKSQIKFRSKSSNELIGNFCDRMRKMYACSVELGNKISNK